MTFEQAFYEGYDAYGARRPLSACPYGPVAEIPEDGINERCSGWLCGWREAEMAEREDVACGLGWEFGCKHLNSPAPTFRSTREKYWFVQGWQSAIAAEARNYASLH